MTQLHHLRYGCRVTTNAKRTVLVLAQEPFGGAGQIEKRLLERGCSVETHWITDDLEQPNRARPFPSIADYDIVVIMGSVRSLTQKAEIDNWIHDEIELLRMAHDEGVPMLGVCFGGQLLAEALGGSVEKAPKAEVGWLRIEAAPGAVNPVGPGPWMEWHHDRFHPPAEAEVLAVTEEATQLFRIGTTVGTQFHPEVSVPHIEAWMGMATDDYLESVGVTRQQVMVDAAANEAANIKQCHQLVDWFLDEVVAPANS